MGNGEWGAAAWLSRHMPLLWDDPARSDLPIAWAFNPNLSERVPYVFDYIQRGRCPQPRKTRIGFSQH